MEPFTFYIENTCFLAILQIPNEYRKIFQGSESTDLLEISQHFGEDYSNPWGAGAFTLGKNCRSSDLTSKYLGLSARLVHSSSSLE